MVDRTQMDRMEVTVFGQLRGATGEKTVSIDFDGGTVREALAVFVDTYPRAGRHLFEDAQRLESSVRVSVNGETVTVDDYCPPDASLSVHPAMQGG